MICTGCTGMVENEKTFKINDLRASLSFVPSVPVKIQLFQGPLDLYISDRLTLLTYIHITAPRILSYIYGTKEHLKKKGVFSNEINNLACSLAPEHTGTHGTGTPFRFCINVMPTHALVPHHHLATIMKDLVTKSKAKKKPAEAGWLDNKLSLVHKCEGCAQVVDRARDIEVLAL